MLGVVRLAWLYRKTCSAAALTAARPRTLPACSTLKPKAGPHRAFWPQPHAKSATQISRKIRDLKVCTSSATCLRGEFPSFLPLERIDLLHASIAHDGRHVIWSHTDYSYAIVRRELYTFKAGKEFRFPSAERNAIDALVSGHEAECKHKRTHKQLARVVHRGFPSLRSIRAQQCLDRATLVHGTVAFCHLVQRQTQIENLAVVD